MKTGHRRFQWHSENERGLIMCFHWRRGMLLTLICAAICMRDACEVGAQATNPPVIVTPSNVIKQSRPYYVEGAVVVLLMAAAGYAVCRSSRRV